VEEKQKQPFKAFLLSTWKTVSGCYKLSRWNENRLEEAMRQKNIVKLAKRTRTNENVTRI